MLYDPKWEKKIETKADPLSLDALIAWLEAKPARGVYCYSDIGHCLAAQYNEHLGRPYRVGTYLFGWEWPGNEEIIKHASFQDMLETVACKPDEKTFGNALDVARRIAAIRRRP